MKTLLILRHAKSSWDSTDLDDHERPLNKRGKEDAPRMGRLIKKENILPDVILSSSAKRARKTAKEVAKNAGFDKDIRIVEDIYGATPGVIIDILQSLSDDIRSVMIVGHNPCFEELVSGLSGGHKRFPTAALAHFELPVENWKELDGGTKGKLLNLWRPNELPQEI